MPIEPPDPLVLSQFIRSLPDYTWAHNYLHIGRSAYLLKVAPSRVSTAGQWTVDSTGAHLSQETFAILLAGDASAGDGSFVSGGVRYWLRPDPANAGRIAICVAA